jgi:hypothetical protein
MFLAVGRNRASLIVANAEEVKYTKKAESTLHVAVDWCGIGIDCHYNGTSLRHFADLCQGGFAGGQVWCSVFNVICC